MAAAKKVNPAERLIGSKKKLVKRLADEIKQVRERAEEDVARIEFRIRQANILLGALEKGTLKT